MNQRYNQDNFEALFKQFLLAGIKEKNTVKNYLSDIRHFLGWLNKQTHNHLSLTDAITEKNLNLYKNYLTDDKIPRSTANRRLSVVRQFCYFCQNSGILKENPAKNLTNISLKPPTILHYQPITNLIDKTKTTKRFTNLFARSNLIAQTNKHFKIILVALLLTITIIISLVGYFFYNKEKQSSVALPAKIPQNKRTIFFTGKLTDNVGNPLITKTEVEFKLYNDSDSGKNIYTSGRCAIAPDSEGIFSVIIGKNCGAEMTNDLFLKNQRVYLGTTVGEDGEMSPRQPIGNVEYAEDSKRLEGYEANQEAQINNIPVINQYGDLVIAARNPKILSTSGNFKLNGEALTFETAAGSAGDITLAPDLGGNTLFKNGSVGVGIDNDFFFKLQTAGSIGPDQDGTYNLGSDSLRWDKIYANEIIGGQTGIQGYFQRDGNIISSTNMKDDLLLGGSATDSATIKLAGADGENSFIKAGNVGIGTKNPQEELTIGADHSFATEMTPPKNVIVKVGSTGALAAGTHYFKIVASDGVRTTVGSSEVSCTTNGSNLTRCALSWDTVVGATSYRIYKGAKSNNQDRYKTSNSSSYNYDSDSDAALGTVPVVTTAYVNKWASSGSSWLLAGHLGLGNSDPSKARLQIDTGSVGIYINNTGSNNSIEDDSGAKLTSSGIWTDASDVNKKTDVKDIGYGLSDLLKIRPVEYLWKETGAADIGFIAQEIQKILPELVFGDEGNLSLAYGHLTSLIVKSIQEQQKNIADLSENVQNLYDKMDNLFTQSITVQKKITSPVVETAQLEVSQSANINNLNTNKITTDEISTPIKPGSNQNQDLVFSGIGDLIVKNLDNATIAVIDQQGNASFSGQLKTESLKTETATISGTLTADKINTDQITASSSSFFDANIKNLTSDSISASDATFSSTLRAQTVEAENITELENKVNALKSSVEPNINEIQQLLADIRNQPLPDPRYYQTLQIEGQNLTDNNLTDSKPILTNDDLTITGMANFYQASIADSLNVGNLLFKDDGLLSLSWELKLTALSSINLLDGAVVIAKNGSLTTKGELIAQGGIRTNTIKAINSNDDISIILNQNLPQSGIPLRGKKFKIKNNFNQEVASIDAEGKAYFNSISLTKDTSATSSAAIIAASNNFAKNGIDAPAIEAKTNSAGMAILPAYSDEVIIYTEKLSDQSLIYITPTTPTQNKTLFVAQKESCLDFEEQLADKTVTCKPYFKVALDQALKADVKFNWWIIN